LALCIEEACLHIKNKVWDSYAFFDTHLNMKQVSLVCFMYQLDEGDRVNSFKLKTTALFMVITLFVSCSKKEDSPAEKVESPAPKVEVLEASSATPEPTEERKEPASSEPADTQSAETQSEEKPTETHGSTESADTGSPQKLSKSVRKKYKILFARHRCLTCHNDKSRNVGPAYRDVAKKYLEDYYKNTNELVARLTTKVRKGGRGNWGKVIMTPHPKVPQEDLEKMVHYIMNLKFTGRKEVESKLKETYAK
jgi:cytochrome c